MSLSARKILLPLHLWSGLILGLVLIVMAVTGSLLVWRKSLETRFNQHLFVVAPGGARLAPEDLVARARVAHPGAELESIRYYGDPTRWRAILDANRGRLPLDGTLPSGLELEIPAK